MFYVKSIAPYLPRYMRRQCLSTASSNCFPGTSMPFVPNVVFRDSKHDDVLPCFRIINEDGDVMDGATDPQLSRALCTKIYSQMIRLKTMDNILYDAQRQGRISFYMTSFGEEAISFGSASALRLRDMVFAQYREPVTRTDMAKAVRCQYIMAPSSLTIRPFHRLWPRSFPRHHALLLLHGYARRSILTCTVPCVFGELLTFQAAGAAYAFKLAKEDRIAVCYFGEGAASEGDFHAALNIASTKDCPILFFVRNNGFAISTPTVEQFRGDGIASRGSGYGIPVMRVDGNDFLAVHEVTRRAREFILKENRPVLIEAMSYRQGHHSTSDDSTQYRAVAEIKHWKETCDPIDRTKRYLLASKYWMWTVRKNEDVELIRSSCLDRNAGGLQRSRTDTCKIRNGPMYSLHYS
uniref:2-oxoisovalerate dehydrogenase subunit alpha n=1 Tax=Hyaloperonospora arabidopsidis (strain Emoy2) TaxID=559515 RepID=M4BDH8_HYAAE